MNEQVFEGINDLTGVIDSLLDVDPAGLTDDELHELVTTVQRQRHRRAAFAAEAGTVGLRARERAFANDLVMRHVGDRMIIAPPLVISKSEIDELVEKARKCLDLTARAVLV